MYVIKIIGTWRKSVQVKGLPEKWCFRWRGKMQDCLKKRIKRLGRRWRITSWQREHQEKNLVKKKQWWFWKINVFKESPGTQWRKCTKNSELSNIERGLLVLMPSCSVLYNSLRSFGLEPTRLLRPWDFSGKNTGVGCHFLLQWIFLIQGLNPHLLCFLNCRWILYPLSCGGSSEQEIKMDRLLKEAAWWDWYDKDEG